MTVILAIQDKPLDDVFTVTGQKGILQQGHRSISVSRLFVTNDLLGKSLRGKKGGCAKRCFIIQA